MAEVRITCESVILGYKTSGRFGAVIGQPTSSSLFTSTMPLINNTRFQVDSSFVGSRFISRPAGPRPQESRLGGAYPSIEQVSCLLYCSMSNDIEGSL